MPKFRPVLVVASLLGLALPAAASAAAPICAPATCSDQGQTRSIVLKRSSWDKPRGKKAKVATTKRKKTSLRVSVKFAPKGSTPRVTVTGPKKFKRVISKSTTFRKVRPGTYTIVADSIPGADVTTFATYHKTRAKLRKGVAGWVGVRFMQHVESKTRVAEPSAIQTVQGDPNGVREVVVEDPQALVQPGTVLAAGVGPQTPGGMLVEVAAVRREGDKTIAVGGPAPLTAIGPQAEIEAEPKLEMSKEDFEDAIAAGNPGAGLKRIQPGFSLQDKPKAFAAKSDNKGFERPYSCSTGARATIDGDVNFNAGTNVGIAWGGVWAPLTIKAFVGVKLHQDARIEVGIEGEAKCELELDLLPKDYRFSPWTFSVGPVPVVIVPKLNFQVTGEASVGARISTWVEQSLDTEFGVQWDGSKFGPYGSAKASFKTYKPTPSGTLNIKAAIGPKLMFDFYDVAGPYLTADLFMQLKADTAKDPWWRLSGGLQAGGGLRFKVWKFNFDKGIRDIWSEDWTIAKADKPPVPAFTTKTLPDAERGKAYSAKVAATSSRAPLTYAVNSGRLPDGLKLESDGRITGTATGYGTRSVEIAAKDSLGQKALRSYDILTKTPPAVIATTALPGAVTGTPYSAKLEATGAVAPYSWTVSGGALPAGLRLAGDTITGTPTAIGAATFTVKVRGLDGNEATRAFTVAVDPAPLAIGTTTLPQGKADVAYSQTLSASGGRGDYTWTATNVPAGLAVSAAGVVSGTPTGPSTAPLAVTVKDADGRTKTADVALTIIDLDALTVTTGSLPQGMNGVAYDHTLTAFGGRAPYQWSADPLTLPTGLSVAGNKLTGTPTVTGTFNVKLKVTDARNVTTERTVALELEPPGMTISTSATLPGADQNTAYSTTLATLGGTGPYTWSIDSGTLPTGLTLGASTGAITGTPTTTGTATFTVKVVSADSAVATKQFTLQVHGAPLPARDLDCPTTTWCMAVDSKNNSYTRSASGEWSNAVASGLPATTMYFVPVTCVSETWCMTGNHNGKVATWDGTAWTAIPDVPAYEVWDISCASQTFCVAAGALYDNVQDDTVPRLWKWDGSTWSAPYASSGTRGWSRINCPAVNSCVMIGNPKAGKFDGNTVTVLADQPHPGNSLACTSTTNCFAGYSGYGTSQYNGTAFNAVNVTSGGTTLYIDPVGCSVAGDICVAGGAGASDAPLWTWNGASWTKTSDVAQKSAAIDCGSPTYCVVVSYDGKSRVWNGTTWSASATFARG